MTVEELDAILTQQWNRLGVVKEQFGDRSVEYSDALKVIAALKREIATMTRGASGGGSMCNLAQYGGYSGRDDSFDEN